MRTNLFRGKCIEGKKKGTWVYGMPLPMRNGECWIIYIGEMSKVDPDSVGQATGMTARDDNDEVNIFEGDICEFTIRDPYYDTAEVCTGVVRYYGAGFKIYWSHRPANGDNWGDLDFALWNSCKSKVIGNIYDNPELLEVSKNE